MLAIEGGAMWTSRMGARLPVVLVDIEDPNWNSAMDFVRPA
jgi:hypothetical protein